MKIITIICIILFALGAFVTSQGTTLIENTNAAQKARTLY